MGDDTLIRCQIAWVILYHTHIYMYELYSMQCEMILTKSVSGSLTKETGVGDVGLFLFVATLLSPPLISSTVRFIDKLVHKIWAR